MKILVVDDQKINRTLPCVLLRQAGCDVEEVESGEAALAALHPMSVRPVLAACGPIELLDDLSWPVAEALKA